MEGLDLQKIIRETIQQYVADAEAKLAPSFAVQLQEERKRREHLERRLDEIVFQNQRSQKMAEEAEIQASIRSELRRAGVVKIDLACKALRGDVVRDDRGMLVASKDGLTVLLRAYIGEFARENPEFLAQ